MKFTKYIAASMIALAGLTSCSDSFLETEYTNYLDSEAAGELQLLHCVMDHYPALRPNIKWDNEHR